MKQVELEIVKRERLGSRASGAYRRGHQIPSVLYAKGEPAVPVLLQRKEFEQAARRCHSSQVFVFKSAAADLQGRCALVKEIQVSYLNKDVLHVDFREVKEGETVRVEIPVELTGEATGVKNQGGVLSVSSHTIAVLCVPSAIPDLISADISGMELNHHLRAGDLALPEGVQLHTPADDVIASVAVPRTVEEEKAPEAAAEGVEGAPVTDAAAAPAADAKKAEPKKDDKKE